ncbi:MAG: SAM-dependent DNA methyltransferase [Desulfobacterales bacterium]|nr:SAM-dependent DNA methyltransferase [Desulfobacterales bacterium]
MARKKKPNLKKETSNGANLGFESQLWAAADKLRGHMDASEYKHVVLGLIFLKYISDAFQAKYQELEATKEADYTDPEDRDEYAAANIFWVPKEARWEKLLAGAKQPTIGKLIDDAMVAIEKENPSLKGVLPKDYARPSLDKHRLGELLDIIGKIGLGDKAAQSKDILGRVYEYFLGRFAAAEGKGGGEFYTPQCVVKLLVRMIEPYKGRVYDPCCGSGGMFVQSRRFAEEHNGKLGDISIYGQESNPTTWKLAMMNMAIRGIDANLGGRHADSFHNDLHKDLRTDFILANPPFNMSDWGGKRLREDVRWKYGIPPISNANFAWVQHFAYHLAPNGFAGFVLAQASLSSESQIENEIRRSIVEDDLVDCIVTLPGKLFYTTPIPVCLWFLARKKNHAKFRNRSKEILFIDASALGMPESRTHSYLSDSDIERIAEAYHQWRSKDGQYEDHNGFCRSVHTDDVRNGGYSLFPAKYVGVVHVDDAISSREFSKNLLQKWDEYLRCREKQHSVARQVDSAMHVAVRKQRIIRPSKYINIKLDDILERSDERLGSRPEPEILTCTERAGLIFQKERFAKRVATKNTSKYKVVRKTDIVYNPYLLWAGAIDQCWIVDIGITSPAYEVLRVRDGFNATLVGALIKSPRMIKTYNGISVGTVQRRRRSPVERFLDLDVVIPSLNDQKRFSELSTAIQNERLLLRETAQCIDVVLLDLCKFWLLYNGIQEA